LPVAVNVLLKLFVVAPAQRNQNIIGQECLHPFFAQRFAYFNNVAVMHPAEQISGINFFVKIAERVAPLQLCAIFKMQKAFLPQCFCLQHFGSVFLIGETVFVSEGKWHAHFFLS